MHFSLVMKLNDGTERKFPLSEKKTLIGRETRCHVRIALPTVAERHCEITLDDGELKLSDLGSELGTLVNGSPVRKTVLGPADELTVGPVTFQVRKDQLPAGESGVASTDPVRNADVPCDRPDNRRAAHSEIELNPRQADALAPKSRSGDQARSRRQ